MLMTLSTTARPATDLGYLLFKHPAKAQRFPQSSGTAHVFYPVAGEDLCTAALLLDVDPVALARNNRGREGYVNDRPYAAGSLLAVTLGSVFRTAMNGRCDERPELAAAAIPLAVRLPAVSCRGGAELAERLFAPMGWRVEARPLPLDPEFPEWGDSHHLDLRLTGELRLADALRHLYVLLPVMDNTKHYWVGEDEVAKLIRAGGDWLVAHPERELISARYLAHRRGYVRTALERLAELDDTPEEEVDEATDEPVVRPLAVVRRQAVLDALREVGARRVLDLGCGPGSLLLDLVADTSFTELVGTDVSSVALTIADRRISRLPDRARARVAVRQSSLTYTDPALAGFDAAVLMEVVEHLDPSRLAALEHVVFAGARPEHVVVTTPNIEYNPLYPTLAAGAFRHPDHRFEWTRAEFREWADGVAARNGYTARFLPVGPEDPVAGSPTQLAVFSKVTKEVAA
ncbi:3' terminal RNA ribose 2'-O-methyltransferase Hen1 [Actinokineospora auranticolor]|uniref:3' terminal RNA ribose 2'-O-methyltransferase Hen1 n=1 Tax=Actinokineospora auranticolor TaxID=155976 RepID=UPI000CEC52DD|nr:3' terminal RNA ribose 2'-O-methyltransferase Hen1 [Actinokineospora auranticolor]